jgi:ribonuclease R
VIETGEGDYKEEILALNDLAKKLRERRFKSGAINFDRYEVKFEIDEQGKPVRVYFKISKDANKLIEEFMLLANRTVAEFVGRPPKGKTKKTFIVSMSFQTQIKWRISPLLSVASAIS